MDRLVTPEAVELDLATATVATRALGRLLDLVLQFAVLIAISVGLAAAQADDVVILVVGLVALLVVRLVYPIAFETRFGATLGQRAMGLRILTTEGGPIRLRQATVRAAVGLFEIEATGGIVALAVAGSRGDGRRLGDLAAGTLAVSVRVGTGRADVLGVTCPPHLEGWARTLDTSALTRAHLAALRRFHERAPTVGPEQREALARALVARLFDALAAPRPPRASATEALAAIQSVAVAEVGSHTGRQPPPPPATSTPPPPPPPNAGSSAPSDAADEPTPGRDGGFAPPA